jgi:hypothetical protein
MQRLQLSSFVGLEESTGATKYTLNFRCGNFVDWVFFGVMNQANQQGSRQLALGMIDAVTTVPNRTRLS